MDKIKLLIIGIVCAGMAWAFWIYAQSEGLLFIVTIALIVAILDNRTLRKKLDDK